MKAARQEIEAINKKRLEYRDILVEHSVKKFREFIEVHREISVDEVDKVLAYSDEKLSEYMHALKCTMPYLGAEFQKSRNHFRRSQLEAALGNGEPTVNLDLEAYIDGQCAYPLCATCHYFRNPPPGEAVACMHIMPGGAIPSDIACTEWRPIRDTALTTR